MKFSSSAKEISYNKWVDGGRSPLRSSHGMWYKAMKVWGIENRDKSNTSMQNTMSHGVQRIFT
jgi:hypothetical protein